MFECIPNLLKLVQMQITNANDLIGEMRTLVHINRKTVIMVSLKHNYNFKQPQ